MRSSRANLLLCTMLAGACAGLPLFCTAADAQTANPKGTPEEVIVTARRRAENIQAVPVAVTAISGATLQRQGITSAYDLPRVAPSLNVNVSSGGGQNQEQLTIRGQRQGDTVPTLDPSIGVYFGDVVLERPYGFGQSLYDLSNVQVLKGPQGTLFGRNTTGGAILLQPNLPTAGFSGAIHTTLGSYNLHEVDGYLNVPLTDQLQLRLAGQHTDRDGYIHNVTTGEDDENENESAFRASLRYKPLDNVDNTLVVGYLDRDLNATGWKLEALNPESPVGGLYPLLGSPTILSDTVAASKALSFYQTSSSPANGGGFANLHSLTVGDTTNWHINDYLNFKNIFGYVHHNAEQFDDVDGSPLRILGYGEYDEGDQFSEEAQVSGKAGPLSYIGGLYYFRENIAYGSITPDELGPFLDGMLTTQAIPERIKNTSESVFASATYDFGAYVPGLSATFGGRETHDNRDERFGTIYATNYTAGQITPLGGVSPGAFCAFDLAPGVNFQPYPSCLVHESISFDKFTYNIDLDYKITPDKLVYFAHRLGYATGGFSPRATTLGGLVPFQPETVNDYELGAKFDFNFDGMFLRTNAAVYYQDYSNIQRLVSGFLNGADTTLEINAKSAYIDGAELEVLFKPRPWFTFSGFLSQTQPKFTSFVIPGNLEQNGLPDDITKTASFAGFPRTTFSLTGRVDLPIPERSGTANIALTYYHQSAYDAVDTGIIEQNATTPGYGLLNIRGEWNAIYGTNFDLAAYSTNLAGTKYTTTAFSLYNDFGFTSTLAGAPRMFGFEGRYHF